MDDPCEDIEPVSAQITERGRETLDATYAMFREGKSIQEISAVVGVSEDVLRLLVAIDTVKNPLG